MMTCSNACPFPTREHEGPLTAPKPAPGKRRQHPRDHHVRSTSRRQTGSQWGGLTGFAAVLCAALLSSAAAGASIHSDEAASPEDFTPGPSLGGPHPSVAIAAAAANGQALCLEGKGAASGLRKKVALGRCSATKSLQLFSGGAAWPSGRFVLHSVLAGGWCLDASDATISMALCTASVLQLWRYDSWGRLVSANDTCVDMRGGTTMLKARLLLAPCSNALTQAWVFGSSLPQAGPFRGTLISMERGSPGPDRRQCLDGKTTDTSLLADCAANAGGQQLTTRAIPAGGEGWPTGAFALVFQDSKQCLSLTKERDAPVTSVPCAPAEADALAGGQIWLYDGRGRLRNGLVTALGNPSCLSISEDGRVVTGSCTFTTFVNKWIFRI